MRGTTDLRYDSPRHGRRDCFPDPPSGSGPAGSVTPGTPGVGPSAPSRQTLWSIGGERWRRSAPLGGAGGESLPDAGETRSGESDSDAQDLCPSTADLTRSSPPPLSCSPERFFIGGQSHSRIEALTPGDAGKSRRSYPVHGLERHRRGACSRQPGPAEKISGIRVGPFARNVPRGTRVGGGESRPSQD